MPNDAYRPIRLRGDALAAGLPGPGDHPAGGAARFLGRIRDGGAIPTAAERVFLASPTALGGAETEGAVATAGSDESRSVPVVVLGPAVPKAGDLVVALAVGGRWVAQLDGRPSPTVPCKACAVPRKDLTLSWNNILYGSGSAVMAFDGVNAWSTGCVNQISVRLECRADGPSLLAAAFLSGPCPGSASSLCSEPGQPPGALSLSAQTCEPFLLRYEAAGCPALTSQGYTRFTITA